MIGPGRDSVDVFIQDQTSPLFQYLLINELKTDITLTSNIAIDDSVVNVSAGHGFTGAAGEHITIWESNRFIQQQVKSVSVNAITLSYPIAQIYTTGAIVIRGSGNINVNASVSPVDFEMIIRDFTIPIDISKIIVTMQHAANVPDDGKFGGIGALTNGMFFRKGNHIKFNLGNYKINQDFKDVGAVVTYTQKAPAGTYATDIVFDIKQIFGQVIRFDSRINDIFCGRARDNLSTLAKLSISLIGSYTEGE